MHRLMICCLLVIVLAAVIPVGADNNKSCLVLLPEITVDEGAVRLAEAGRFQGDPKLASEIARIDLGEAPPPGQFRWVTRNYVLFKLAQAGIGEEDIRLTMPERVRLVGAGVKLTAEQVLDFLRKNLAPEVPETWTVWSLQLAGALGTYWLPPGKVTMERELVSDLLKPGNNLMKIRLVKDGEVLRRFSLAVRVTARGHVPVLKSDVKRHAILNPKMIIWEERELEGGEMMKFSTKSVRATRRLRQAEPILEKDIEPIPQVTKGSRVIIEYITNGIKIKVVGEARRDGWTGQIIPVMNIDSRKTVSARVVDTGKVEVR